MLVCYQNSELNEVSIIIIIIIENINLWSVSVGYVLGNLNNMRLNTLEN